MNRRNIVVYICAPYRGKTISEICDNIDQAKQVAKQLWSLGVTALCPHMNTAFILDGLIPDEEILAGTMELMKRSDIVYVVGKMRSQGMINEIEEAIRIGMPVCYNQNKLIGLVKEIEEKIFAKEKDGE